MEDKTGESVSFFQHVFNFDDDTKSELLNISQYSLLALIPTVLVIKLVQNVIPEADDSKRSFEILAEVVGQLTLVLVGMFFIHRLITFVPTYSGDDYKLGNIVSIILPFLMILLSLQKENLNLLAW